jgi:hypothetical protein
VPKGPTKRPTRAPALRLTRTPTRAPTPFQRILIRCGSGAAYTNTLGQQWLGDQYYIGGLTFTSSSSFAGTKDDGLYAEGRYGHFAEPVW